MIPFPRFHIAESTINRILNAIEGEPSLGIPMPTPIPPDPIAEGTELDSKISQPPVAAEPPPEAEQSAQDGLVSQSLQGGSPFDGALVGTLGP